MKKLILLILCINFIFVQNQLASSSDKNSGFKKLDIDKDFESLKKACDLGVTSACKNLAIAYRNGTKTIKKDLNKFIFYIDKLCEQKDYKACELAGRLYLGYKDIKKDNKKSYQFFKSTCVNANHDESCFFVAHFEKLGLGGAPKNPFQSERTFKRLCQKNYKDSCTVLKNFHKTLNIKTNKRYLEEKAKFEQRQQSTNYVVDPQTNLMWQDDSDTNIIKRNFKGAIKYCDELELGGYDDWRLPNASEVFSLVDENEKNYTNSIIKYANKHTYWSQTTSSKDNQTMWGVWFERSWFPSHVGLKGQLYVRCVRGKELPLDRDKFYISWEER